MLTAGFGFYDFHARHGVEFAKALIDQTRSGRGGYKPFLHGFARAKPRGRVGRLREDKRLPATLTLAQVAAVIHAQQRLETAVACASIRRRVFGCCASSVIAMTCFWCSMRSPRASDARASCSRASTRGLSLMSCASARR